MHHLLFNRIIRKLFVSGKPPSCILECAGMLIGVIYICNHKKSLMVICQVTCILVC